ncbi:hypothetical protein AB0G60_11075 [Streptomyces angustmyceticus]|uniref:Uncharacterized protein n=1 Tax=Streptomyces angustmyceticus TaxID=285578 RepID=A0A5J4L6V7_9ACTN|nr:hypothetical protein [Streptomyces angustmyceticus]UAL70602.1 hypothetical protein K7396_31915 [Streptomyces angustmyceticus]GES30107.1 hypothetical protein San01_25940 [Streptomyces angustmyceticus]
MTTADTSGPTGPFDQPSGPDGSRRAVRHRPRLRSPGHQARAETSGRSSPPAGLLAAGLGVAVVVAPPAAAALRAGRPAAPAGDGSPAPPRPGRGASRSRYPAFTR